MRECLMSPSQEPSSSAAGASPASHDWVVLPIRTATSSLEETPFFDWLRHIQHVRDFAPVARQLYHHSLTLPRAIAFMLSVTDRSASHLYKLYAEHAYEEADHHLLALDWMLQHGLAASKKELDDSFPTIETTSYINIAYHIAMERDHDMWIATMQTAIERCFFIFFEVASRKMNELGAGHEYFDIHVTADEHHSTADLEFLSAVDPTSSRATALRTHALDGVALWAAMVHSWIGIPFHPRFDPEGKMLRRA